MPSSHLILCHPLLLLPPIPPSIRVFSNESTLHMRWPKYWSFSFSITPSNEHPGLISFRMDWLDLLAGQGTLKSLLQHHRSKASILQCSAFFMVQLSHPYITTGKIIVLTIWTFCPYLCFLIHCLGLSWASWVAQTVKNLPAVQETWVQSLGRKIPSEEYGNLLQYSCLENPMDRGVWWTTVDGSQRVGHN